MEIHLHGETVKIVNTFTYLGSTLMQDGELGEELTHRVQSGWKILERVSEVLCDRTMNVKTEEKVYRTVIGPTLVYRSRVMGNGEGIGKEIIGGRRHGVLR